MLPKNQTAWTLSLPSRPVEVASGALKAYMPLRYTQTRGISKF